MEENWEQVREGEKERDVKGEKYEIELEIRGERGKCSGGNEGTRWERGVDSCITASCWSPQRLIPYFPSCWRYRVSSGGRGGCTSRCKVGERYKSEKG